MERQSVTLADIIKHRNTHLGDRETFLHKGYFSTRFSSEMAHPNMLFEPIRIDAIALILCTEGCIDFSCNLEEFHVEAGSLLLLPPKSLILGRGDSSHYAGHIAIMDMAYLGECNFNVSRFTSFMVQHVNNICVKLTKQEQSRLQQSLELLHHIISEEVSSPFREDIIRSMIEMLIYTVCEDFALHSTNEESGNISRQESYFRQFIHELSAHYAERQGVGYYADKLCISARYLTTIVRRVSGLTVTDWMNRYLIMEAKYLLKYSELSIQEVAYRLSFPDQSFFGKYFKQHVGVSPSHYRNHQ